MDFEMISIVRNDQVQFYNNNDKIDHPLQAKVWGRVDKKGYQANQSLLSSYACQDHPTVHKNVDILLSKSWQKI